MQSFLIHRPGLKEGLVIPFGIHVLDTLWLVIIAIMVPASLVIWVCYFGPIFGRLLPAWMQDWKGLLAIFAGYIVFARLLAYLIGMTLRWIGIARGILTIQQARLFPLNPLAKQGGPKPWPEEWQRSKI